jgi:hypothetical protein
MFLLAAVLMPLVFSFGQAFLAAGAKLSPAPLYVSSKGSDSHSCRRVAPCRTLRRADALARPGTIIHVAPGRYGPARLRSSGTPTARISWVSDRRWGASISATRVGALSVVALQGAYVDFRGFDVSGRGEDGTVGIDVEGNYSRAIGNHVHNLAIRCRGPNGGAGIDLSGSETGHGQEAISNFVSDVGTGPRNGSCRLVHGIYASRPGVKILTNVVARSLGDGITSWHSATNLIIANNTSVSNGGNGILIGGNDLPFNRESYVVNNIAAFNWRGGIVECCDASPPFGARYIDNLTFGTRQGPDGPRPDGPSAAIWGTVHTRPRFVNRADGDYRLQPGSPAIGTGTILGAPARDIDGYIHPTRRVNRGAFFSSADPRP